MDVHHASILAGVIGCTFVSRQISAPGPSILPQTHYLDCEPLGRQSKFAVTTAVPFFPLSVTVQLPLPLQAPDHSENV